jgi:simple sugar transport system permease protein
VSDGGPPPGRGDPGYPDWFARVTGVGLATKDAIVVPILAVLTALVIGGIIIAISDVDTLRLWGESPGEAARATAGGVFDAYKELFRGSFGSVNAITQTLFAATPLILAGLAVAVGFQAGLFNIGVNGQMMIGGMFGLWVAFSIELPAILHIPLAVGAAIIGGALWGGIPGLLRARTGAHEVITTIMLNFIALFLVDYLLKTSIFQQEGRNDPISEAANESARFPTLFGDFRLHIGFLIALAAVALVWWVMYRSTFGFEFRAVGFNPDGGHYAGISVAWVYVTVMAFSGALAGVAGANQLLGLEPYRAVGGFAGTTGFDAIALALLGRSHPIGVLLAGLLFGALRAGGRTMQGAAQIPIDIVLVLQALIIVLIAAPELVRAIYRIKPPEQEAAAPTTGWGA